MTQYIVLTYKSDWYIFPKELDNCNTTDNNDIIIGLTYKRVIMTNYS